jgi:hypothetical protein
MRNYLAFVSYGGRSVLPLRQCPFGIDEQKGTKVYMAAVVGSRNLVVGLDFQFVESLRVTFSVCQVGVLSHLTAVGYGIVRLEQLNLLCILLFFFER